MNDLAETQGAALVEKVVVGGDLSKLNAQERLQYYARVCESVGLNPLTRPFEYMTLQGKMILYARRDAADQLRRVHGVSIKITDRQSIEGLYIVTAQATDKSGRCDEAIGAVSTAGLKGADMANAIMKAETKAKRRVTLSICGLGLLDETEIDDAAPTATEQPECPPELLKLASDAAAGGLDTYSKFWTELSAEERKQIGVSRHTDFKAKAQEHAAA